MYPAAPAWDQIATKHPSKVGLALSGGRGAASAESSVGFVGSGYFDSFKATQVSPFKISAFHLFPSKLNLYLRDLMWLQIHLTWEFSNLLCLDSWLH